MRLDLSDPQSIAAWFKVDPNRVVDSADCREWVRDAV